MSVSPLGRVGAKVRPFSLLAEETEEFEGFGPGAPNQDQPTQSTVCPISKGNC
jgi:hypothetical protein